MLLSFFEKELLVHNIWDSEQFRCMIMILEVILELTGKEW